jgi:hypothetical protein
MVLSFTVSEVARPSYQNAEMNAMTEINEMCETGEADKAGLQAASILRQRLSVNAYTHERPHAPTHARAFAPEP